ncbi:hypothetical protein POM88_028990 [Heracleum sosnowskyi]|uniref:Protein kinase domain-containing protein n=1 Tax=Heracleum sosnowskyi TaxID=360622 RepID=A0AAD8MH96_9APIA|nr:hypothetical protein POM88_028990 [Heracleum sosnowskyi]
MNSSTLSFKSKLKLIESVSSDKSFPAQTRNTIQTLYLYFNLFRFLFPTLGGLLYGYDVGATSSDIISLQDYRCGSGIKISNQQGTLTDGRVVAVKKLSVASHQGKSQFVAEIATISAVQHRNLVKLYGCCIEGDKRLLVYEYLENNNLEQALFGKTNLFLDCGYLAPEYAMRGHLTEKLMSLGLVWLLLKLLEESPILTQHLKLIAYICWNENI